MEAAAPAAHNFFQVLLRSGGPLQTASQAAFSNQRAHLPPAQHAAFECPGAGDATAIIHEVFGSSISASVGRDAALDALNDPRTPTRVQTGADIMTAAECAILCRHCDTAMEDSQRGGTRDNVDGLPDFQVNLTLGQIEDLLQHEKPPSNGGRPAEAFVERFAGLLTACAASAAAAVAAAAVAVAAATAASAVADSGVAIAANGVAAANHGDCFGYRVETLEAAASKLRIGTNSREAAVKEWGRVGIFVRRYSASTRPWMPFHCDGNAFTANASTRAYISTVHFC